MTISSTTPDAGGDPPADHQGVVVLGVAAPAPAPSGLGSPGAGPRGSADAGVGRLGRPRVLILVIVEERQKTGSLQGLGGRLQYDRACGRLTADPATSRSQRLFLPGLGRERVWGRRNPEAVDSLETIVVAPAETLVLGRYRLRERLGTGGFGVVWRAHDEELHREVAVKRIWLNPDGDLERAMREAQATARLSHPAIVALYEAQADGEVFYLISELVHGETLATVLEGGAAGRRPASWAPRPSQSTEGELTDEEILALGVALADALEHAHGRGVIHRDVKPQNILVPHDPVERAVGVAKLTDFGGAHLAGEDALTRTGDVLGTLAYMSPEQCEGREATGQADLYSLALVLYEALSGVNPVRGANPAATARRIGGELPPLHHYRRDLPRELTEALDEALAPTPEHRGTLPELREVLEEGLAGSPGKPRRRRPRRPEPREARTATYRDNPPPTTPHAYPHPSPGMARSSSNPNQDDDDRDRHRRLRFPRAVWIVLTAALALWQSLAGRPGVALLVVAARHPCSSRAACPPWR